MSDNLEQEISLPAGYANVEGAQTFEAAFRRLRLFNTTIPNRKFSPANAPAAVRQFYGGEYPLGPADEVDPQLYEQWGFTRNSCRTANRENPADGGYAFHRCLSALNVYLQAFALARNDDRVRPISSRELRPIVIVGSINLGGVRSLQSPMLMHPDAKTLVRSDPARSPSTPKA